MSDLTGDESFPDHACPEHGPACVGATCCCADKHQSSRIMFPFTTPQGSDAEMFIQWKGTEVCLDFYCPCGESSHLDSAFAYFVQCPSCDTVFELGTQVIIKRVQEPTETMLPKLMEAHDD